MMSNLGWTDIQQFIRIGLQWGSGMLVTKGYLASSETEIFVGGAMSAVAFVWWWVWNRTVAVPAIVTAEKVEAKAEAKAEAKK
jgi:hypothetical protein